MEQGRVNQQDYQGGLAPTHPPGIHHRHQHQHHAGTLLNPTDDIDGIPQPTVQTAVPGAQGGTYDGSDISTGPKGYGYDANQGARHLIPDDQPGHKSVGTRAMEVTETVVGGMKKGLDKVLPGRKMPVEETTRVAQHPDGAKVVEHQVRHK